MLAELTITDKQDLPMRNEISTARELLRPPSQSQKRAFLRKSEQRFRRENC